MELLYFVRWNVLYLVSLKCIEMCVSPDLTFRKLIFEYEFMLSLKASGMMGFQFHPVPKKKGF
jgi:hypothetical protein